MDYENLGPAMQQSATSADVASLTERVARLEKAVMQLQKYPVDLINHPNWGQKP